MHTLAWESVPNTYFTDCHTSDICHWFAMTRGVTALQIEIYKYRYAAMIRRRLAAREIMVRTVKNTTQFLMVFRRLSFL